MEKECKNCKSATGRKCSFHSKFRICYDYNAVPRYIFNVFELQELADGSFGNVLTEQRKFY